MLTSRLAVAMLSVAFLAGSLSAQHKPWVLLDLGTIGIHERIPTRFHGTESRTTADIGLGISVGLPVTRWLVPIADFRSSIGRDLPFHSISLGLAVRSTNARRAYFHIAYARMLASQGSACETDCNESPNGNDRRWGMELRTGMSLLEPEQFTLGPTLWYQQSLSPSGSLLATYKTFGLGLQIGFN